MRLSQDKIYRRYSVIRKITLWTELSVLLALPLVGIMMYVFRENEGIGKVVMTLGSIYLGLVVLVVFVIRRCPNCLSHLPGYVFDPKKCPYCGAKLIK